MLGFAAENIILGKLKQFFREDVKKLPKDKPVYVHCFSGMRSYIACRLLTGNGYDTYNLAGGFRFFESAALGQNIPESKCTKCK